MITMREAREVVARMPPAEGRFAAKLTKHEAAIWLEIRHHFPEAELLEGQEAEAKQQTRRT